MNENSQQEAPKGTLASYITGFVVSIILTLAAYTIVTGDLFSRTVGLTVVIGLALVQLCVQLYFFLHVRRRSSQRWNFVVLLFAIMVVIIVVFGSLWIMNNLNYNMTQHMNTDMYMHDHEGI